MDMVCLANCLPFFFKKNIYDSCMLERAVPETDYALLFFYSLLKATAHNLITTKEKAPDNSRLKRSDYCTHPWDVTIKII